MDCMYHQKVPFFKYMIGLRGYCKLHKTYIKKYTKMSYHPYVCCKGAHGELFNNCATQLRVSYTDT